MKRPYRIKHVPTGLYYKPGSFNLTKNGKVYITGGSILSYSASDWIHCRVQNLKHREMLEDLGIECIAHATYRISKSQFVIEEI